MTTIFGQAGPPPRWEQFTGTVAQNYHRHLVAAIFQPWAEELLAHAAPRRGERVLDVACGTGVVARAAARLVGSGRVTGLDINPGMLAMARAQPGAEAICWREGDAVQLPFPDGSFDLVLCQQGVQFFSDRVAGLREMRRVLTAGGRMVLAVWGPIEQAPGFAALADSLERRIGATAAAAARSPFAVSDLTELRALLAAAGLPTVHIQDRERLLRFPSPTAFVHRYIHSSPIAVALGDTDADTAADTEAGLDAVVADLTAGLASYCTEQGLVFPIANHLLVTAT
jgi:SAM-dependent methyltransferase